MQKISSDDFTYRTKPVSVGLMARMAPSLTFYPKFLAIVYASSRIAKRGKYDGEAWQVSSLGVLHGLESVGVTIDVSGFDHLQSAEGPVLIIGNHLSMMETVILPALILQFKPVTFVIKQSLLEFPVFKHVMAATSPIALTRTNPRQDLKTVLDEGVERLSRNLSIVIFPQTTRTAFNPEQFSSIGIKLAKRAGVKVVPLALLTDAWENGTRFKDFGKIVPERKAYFEFGAPMDIAGKGNEEHQQIIEFIQSRLDLWHRERRAGDVAVS
jgi:1-acyl-sn-glycerol-3-phosphate acyltransferase